MIIRRSEGGDQNDVTLKLGLHLFRDPGCAKDLYDRSKLDPKLRELASLAITAPKLVQDEGFPLTAWNLGSQAAFELAVFLELMGRYSWLDIGTVESCLTELDMYPDFGPNDLRLIPEERVAESERPK